MAKATQEKPFVKDGKLTRAGMEDAIRSGGSVQMPDGRVLTSVKDLPSEAELAKGDPQLEKEVALELKKQIADLSGQLKDLQSQVAAPPGQAAGDGQQGGQGQA